MKVRYAIACMVLAGGAVQAAKADEKVQALVKDIQAATLAAKSLTADVALSQTGAGPDVKATGTVKLKRPNLARIEFGEPFNNVIASDGKDVVIYMKQDNEYQKTPADPNGKNINGSGALQVPLFFKAGGDDFGVMGLKLSSATLVGSEKRGAVEYRVLELARNAAQKYRFYIAPNNLITGMTVEIKQGIRNIKVSSFMTNVKVNTEIAAADFAYKPPQTAKLYEEPNFEAKLLKVGSESPPFELTNPADKARFSLAKVLDGRKAVLVNFWFRN